MEFLLLKILIGFIVGTLIGLTGLGGGVLLLPMLIFGLRVPAIIAVGSDALFNFFTKIPASIMHLRKGTVRKKVVWRWRRQYSWVVTSALLFWCTCAMFTAMASTTSSSPPWDCCWY
jgi:hypothetical protein